MKRYLLILLVFGLIFVGTPHSLVLAQDPTTTSETVASEDTPSSTDTTVEETETAPAPVPPVTGSEDPVKLPWFVVFLWPVISTAIVGVVKAVSDKLKKEAPPQLWPLINTVLVAVITGVQSSGSPYEVIGNVVAAVISALGLVKAVDSVKGKWSTVTPEEKKAAVTAGVVVR